VETNRFATCDRWETERRPVAVYKFSFYWTAHDGLSLVLRAPAMGCYKLSTARTRQLLVNKITGGGRNCRCMQRKPIARNSILSGSHTLKYPFMAAHFLFQERCRQIYVIKKYNRGPHKVLQ
jgi:hypothetical protein